MFARPASVLIGLLTALVLLSAPAAAHKTVYSPDNKIKFVYGNFNEPVYTFQKTGLDLIISDNATGAPITGLDAISHATAVPPKINVTIRYGAEGGEELDITTKFTAQFGKPGAYTYPIMYTKPGLYYVIIRGPINGTTYNMVIPPAHEMSTLDTIMWPEQYPLDDQQAEELASLKSQIDQLKSEVASLKSETNGEAKGQSPSIEAAILLVGMFALAMAWRRRA